MGSVITPSGSGWTLQNDLLALSLNTAGAISLRPRDTQATWLNARPGIVWRAASGASQLHTTLAQSFSVTASNPHYSDQLGSGARLTLEAALPIPGLRLTLIATIYDDLPCVRLQPGVQNTSGQSLRIEQLLPVLAEATEPPGKSAAGDEQTTSRHPLSINGRTSGWACYQEGWQSWSYAGALAANQPGRKPHNRSLRAMHQPFYTDDGWLFHSGEQIAISEAVTLVGFPQSFPALLVGFVRGADFGGQIMLDRQTGRLAAISYTEGMLLKPGGECWAEPLLLGFGAEDALLTCYAAMVAREMGARTGRENPTGWCSWYYYFTRVTRQDVLENLHALSASKAELPLRVIQIDDGYQTAVGDWTSINEKFPEGMQALAATIREQGFQPGLWLAPFTATANSQLFQAHPDWILRNGRGRPAFGGKNWGSLIHGLDCTHPQVQDWLRRLFATIVETWGYTYLKLDFLYCAALPGVRKQPQMTSVQALRQGLQTIRSIVGEEVFLIGCGCPLLPAVGLVDAMRVGPDVAPQWPARFHGLPAPNSERATIPSAANATRNSLTRAWMHRMFWINDPDCLLIRDTDIQLNDHEGRTLASAIGLTGGMLVLSDPMHTLNDERRSLARALLPPLDQAAQPRSWLDEGWPGIITLHIARPWAALTLAGVFNWTNHPQNVQLQLASLGLAPGRFHICEFWTRRYFGIVSDSLQLHLPAHSSAVLALQPATERPTLLSTDFHLGQGAVEVQRLEFDAAARSLYWEINLGRTAAGSTRLFVPPAWRPGALTTSAQEATLRAGSQPGEYHLRATIHGTATFSLALEGNL